MNLVTSVSLLQKTLSKNYNYYQNDHLYTPQQLIDKRGNTNWQAQYQAFGDAQVITETVENNLRFPGHKIAGAYFGRGSLRPRFKHSAEQNAGRILQYYDKESGLYQNYFRDYNPQLGRYIESDPIELYGGVNTFGYVYQAPLRYYDPTGEVGAAVAVAGLLYLGWVIYCMEAHCLCSEDKAPESIEEMLKQRKKNSKRQL